MLCTLSNFSFSQQLEASLALASTQEQCVSQPDSTVFRNWLSLKAMASRLRGRPKAYCTWFGQRVK